MAAAATGIAKRSVIPVELSAVVVLVFAAALCIVEIAAMVRMLFVTGVPRLSRTGAIVMLSGAVCAPLILWLRGGLAVSSMVAVVISVNVTLFALSVALIALRRALSGRATQERQSRASFTETEPASSATRRTRVRRSRGA